MRDLGFRILDLETGQAEARRGAPPSTIRDPDSPIAADQAIFTSIRSGAGTGYRLIAASPGVRAEEKQELTQRCPSHASLTAEGELAEGLAAWRLRTGRYAVVWSRHAGLEPTARGGFRVHSHVVVLNDAEYHRFDYNPTRVQVALADALDPEPLLEPPAALDLLALEDPRARAVVWASALGIGCKPSVIFALVERLLAGRRSIVTGVSSAVDTHDAVVAAMPLCLRPGIGVSIGLKFSPAREAALIFLDGPNEQARQLTRGQNFGWLDANSLADASEGDTADWLSLMRQWWTDGRRRDFCQLAARITEDASAVGLQRLAAICQDADRLNDGDSREELTRRYQTFVPSNRLESELVGRLKQRMSSVQATVASPGSG